MCFGMANDFEFNLMKMIFCLGKNTFKYIFFHTARVQHLKNVLQGTESLDLQRVFMAAFDTCLSFNSKQEANRAKGKTTKVGA